ncbi:hypothetical protein MKX03_023653 [Papaver bracteatum]|nr:hypothetical protein MKX03_023653 [Papaver bracteatum]
MNKFIVDQVLRTYILGDTGEGSKRDADEGIEQKCSLKKNKFDESKNPDWSSLNAHSVSKVKAIDVCSSEFRTETNNGAAAPDIKLHLNKNSFDEVVAIKKQQCLAVEHLLFPMKSTAASKTLIASNLSASIDKSHVLDFFQQVGNIVDVRFYLYNGKDGKPRISYALVEFATEEAAKKAIQFQHLDLFGYDVRLSPQLGASKRLVMKGLPYYTDKSDVIKFFKQAGEIVDVQFIYNDDGKFSGSAHIEFVTEEAAKKAARFNGLDLLGSHVDIYRKAKGTGASKTLCLKNIPLSINKSHVIDFFKNVGDIADVRFSYDEYGTFGRIAHVEFATEEAARMAVKWSGRDFKGRPVEPGIVRETLCVQGFDTSSGIDQIRIFLKKHFRTCKSIVKMDIPTDSYSGVPLGTALIEFSSLQAFHRALDLDGQEVDGTSLTIKDYVPVCLDEGTSRSKNSCRGYDDAGLEKAGSSRYPPFAG